MFKYISVICDLQEFNPKAWDIAWFGIFFVGFYLRVIIRQDALNSIMIRDKLVGCWLMRHILPCQLVRIYEVFQRFLSLTLNDPGTWLTPSKREASALDYALSAQKIFTSAMWYDNIDFGSSNMHVFVCV